MKKTFFFILLAIGVTTQSCRMESLLSVPQMQQVADSEIFICQADKDPSTFVTTIKRPKIGTHDGDYIISIQTKDGAVLKETSYDPDHFLWDAAYIHFFPEERSAITDTLVIILFQKQHKQGKQWIEERTRQQLAISR